MANYRVNTRHKYNNNNNNNNNSILGHLLADLTAQRPVTKLARVRRKRHQKLANKIQNKAFYIIIIIIIIIIKGEAIPLAGREVEAHTFVRRRGSQIL
jgi:hypothetical protein